MMTQGVKGNCFGKCLMVWTPVSLASFHTQLPVGDKALIGCHGLALLIFVAQVLTLNFVVSFDFPLSDLVQLLEQQVRLHCL